MNLVWQDDVEWWEYVIKHAKRFGWAATWDVVIWLILAALGHEFLSLGPRLSVRPHVKEWDCRRLTNLLRSIHELPSLGFPFGICIEIETRWRKRCIHTWCGRGEGCLVALNWIPYTKRTVPRPRMADLSMAARTFRRGSWNRSTWGKGCRRPPLHQRLTEWRHVANGDSHHVWVKLYTPVGLNLFEKSCPWLWTTWRQMPDHKEL
jgi:hypothetical protein